MRAALLSLMGELAERDGVIARQGQEAVFKQAQIDKLTHENALLKRMKFAAQSERFSAEQKSLLDESLDEDLQAVADEIGQLLGAKMVVILIGERPGLSSPDSLGVYLTWQPHRQRLESERNCISNIRPEGLSYDAAAFKLAWLLEQAFLRRLTGVRLKDESDNPALHGKIKPLTPLK